MEIADFPGFVWVSVTKRELDLVVTQNVASWESALASVSGVYLITDAATGKFYVGSATGEGGIWARWASYSATGHGGNKELRALLKGEGTDYAANFRFSVLETADTHTTPDEIVQRRATGVGVRSLDEDDENLLLFLRYQDPTRSNQSYVEHLYLYHGTVVSESLISIWFAHVRS